MMGPSHRLLGALAGVSAATLADQSWELVAMSGLVVTATSAGWSSPDIDQSRPWVRLRRALPSPLDKALNHRELSHWWGLPVIGAWWSTTLPPDAAWPAMMLVLGWCSHVVGDATFGTVPLLPTGAGPRVGLGFDTGGLLESHLTRPLLVVLIGVVLLAPWAPWGDLPVRGAAHPTSQPSDPEASR